MRKIIILGVHNSGSTLLAGMMHYLRINFGLAPDEGRYGLSYEAHDIQRAIRDCVQFGKPIDWVGVEECKERLSFAVNDFFRKWMPLDSALKHPYLCAGLTVVDDDVLGKLTFIDCSRPLRDSINGAIRAYPRRSEHMAEYQTNLHEGKQRILDRAKGLGCTVYDWNYNDITPSNCSDVVDRLQQFLDTRAKPEYVEKAISLFDETQRHFVGRIQEQGDRR